MSTWFKRMTFTTLVLIAVLLIGVTGALGATVIELATWYNPGDELGWTLRSILDDFEALNPDIRVETQFTPFHLFHEKLVIESIVGVAADVSFVSGMHFYDFAHSGTFLPVSRIANVVPHFSMDDFYAESGAQGEYEGTYYALPFAGGPQRALWYNRDVFSEVGLDANRPPQTWSELIDAGRLLTRIAPDGTVLRHALNDDLGLAAWGVANGASIVNEDGQVDFATPLFEEAVDLFIQMVSDQMVRPEPDWSGRALATGDVAMDTNGSWMRGTFDNLGANVGLAQLPRGSENGRNLHSADLIAVLATTQDTEKEVAAWKLAAFLTSPEVQARWAMTTGFPPMNRNTIRTSEYLDFVMENPAQFMATEMMEHIYAFPPISRAFEVEAIAHRSIWEVIHGDVSPIEGLERATLESRVVSRIEDES